LKFYYLKLSESDFIKDGTSWTSPVINLYENASYTNYSTIKSTYGPDPIGNNTWVGLDYSASTGISSIGRMSGSRFIDESGRIDILEYEIDINHVSGYVDDIRHSLSVYTATENNAATPHQWMAVTGKTKLIQAYNIEQYAYFQIDFDTDHYIADMTIDFYVKIGIDRPIIDPLYDRARVMMDKFPGWTDIYADSAERATPHSATPNTLGGHLINAMSGEYIEQIDKDLNSFAIQSNIVTADADQLAYIYKIDIPGIDRLEKIVCDGVVLSNCLDTKDLYDLTASEDGYLWVQDTHVIYVHKQYTTITINDGQTLLDDLATPGTYTAVEVPIWNWFDEFGIQVDLRRLPSESNDIFRKRILDVYRNRGGVGLEPFKLSLRRELDLWQSYGATPDSNYFGATPSVYGLSELKDLVDGASPYMGYNDIPTDKFRELIRKINKNYPTTWGNLKWEEALWDISGEEGEGYSQLPYEYDAATPSDDYLHSGVGGLDDLALVRPDIYPRQEAYSVDLTARGHVKSSQTEYPKVTVNLTLKGIGGYTSYANPTVSEWLTLSVVHSGTTYYTNFQASAKSNISSSNYLNSEFSTYRFFNSNGYSRIGLTWYDASGGEHRGDEATPFILDKANITAMNLLEGQFDPGTQTQINIPASRDYRAWFTSDSGYNNFPAGTAGAFDGSTNALNISGAGNFPVTVGTNTYTTAWVVFDFAGVADLSNTPRLIASKNGLATTTAGWEIRLSSAGLLTAVCGDGTTSRQIDSAASLVAGNRYVAALVIDGSTGVQEMKLYVNSLAETPSSISTLTAIDSGLTSVIVGAAQTVTTGVPDLTKAFNGNIYACGVISSALTQADIAGICTHYATSHGDPQLAYDTFNSAQLLKRKMDSSATDDKANTVAVSGTLSVNTDALVPDGALMLEMGETTLSSTGLAAATPVFSDVVYEAVHTVGTPSSTWASQEYAYTLEVNAPAPSTLAHNKSINIPDIFFTSSIDNLFDPIPNKAIEITINSAISVDQFGASVDVPVSNLFIDGSNTWTSNAQSISDTSVSTVLSSDYTIAAPVWSPFEYTASNISAGTVDKNGPYKDGNPQALGGVSNDAETLYLTRNDFGIPNDASYVVRWIGVTSSGGNVNAWIDTNVVKPAVDEYTVAQTYPTNVITETLNVGVYDFSPINLKVAVKRGADKQWNPALQSGYFYTKDDEHYLYADEKIEYATPSSSSMILGGVARQGAPIIVKTEEATPNDVRQVMFWDDTGNISVNNTEVVNGSGTNSLYVSYNDLYNLFVVDKTTGATPTLSSTTTTSNVVSLTLGTDRSHEYDVSYTVNNSFAARNDYLYADGTNHTRLIFDKMPSASTGTNYKVWYENSEYLAATPITLPLHPFYTVIDNGFVYISYNEYSVASAVEVRFSPSTITANGTDYIMMSFRTYDINGNPKPNQTFNLTTDFGTIGNSATPTSSTTVVTDRDGFSSVHIFAGNTTSTTVGTVSITGDITSNASFVINPVDDSKPLLIADVTADRIPSDGTSGNYIYGKYLDATMSGLSGETIYWRKGRNVYDTFSLTRIIDSATPGMDKVTGSVTTNSDGSFSVGPFNAATPSDTGYWYVALEGGYVADATPKYEGDMVYWHEYPDQSFGADKYSGLVPRADVGREWWNIPEHATPVMFPTYYDESAGDHATPNSVDYIWESPEWYAMDRYEQYQLGYLGNQYDVYDYLTAKYNKHPDYKDL